MLFNEVYGSYYNVVAKILAAAVNGDLTGKRLTEFISQKGFQETSITVPSALQDGSWPLLTAGYTTPIKHQPTMPLTILQKRWLKALCNDPRIRLFSPDTQGLEDVEPLYRQDSLVYFDQYADGDPYEDSDYQEHFHTILQALAEKKLLQITLDGQRCKNIDTQGVPYRLEYSPKDDKFRLWLLQRGRYMMVNLARITRAEISDKNCNFKEVEIQKKAAVLEITDERNALERAMLHFSHLEKVTEQLDKKRYKLTVRYQAEDENEMLIRILAFGPMIKVIEPASLKDSIRYRIFKQKTNL